MHISRFLAKFFGSLLFTTGFLLLIALLLLVNVDKQMDNIDVIVHDALTTFFEQHQDEILGDSPDNDQFQQVLEQCEQGLLPKEDCAPLLDGSIFTEQLEENEQEMISEVMKGYQPVKAFLSYVPLLFLLLAFMFGFSGWLFLYGVKYDWMLWLRTLSWKVAFSSLLFYFILSTFMKMSAASLVKSMGATSVSDIPSIFAEFSASILLTLMRPAVYPLVKPLLIIGIVSAVIFLIALILSWTMLRSTKKMPSLFKKKDHK